MSMTSLRDTAIRCLATSDPLEKVRWSQEAAAAWRSGRLVDDRAPGAPVCDTPGRPARLELVDPRRVPKRKLTTSSGRAALVHAVAHIEFNAINLAWDAVQRFDGMPHAYYDDWVRIAAEEAQHFDMMRGRLAALGHDYGDFPAHDGLWDMARKTASDPLIRMALVPRVLEARGLDVTPGMISRLEQVDDRDTADALRVIYREEIGHVAAGTRWFQHLCEQRGLEPVGHFLALLREHLDVPPKGPFNEQARREAGFSQRELDALEDASHARDRQP